MDNLADNIFKAWRNAPTDLRLGVLFAVAFLLSFVLFSRQVPNYLKVIAYLEAVNKELVDKLTDKP